mmetsp:Transcript_81781/g.181816  ORF Transcript_81781/g.181816 Transcript_81781/m.181816 type:complete len:215 (-) Transcript_81781:72-716(-)
MPRKRRSREEKPRVAEEEPAMTKQETVKVEAQAMAEEEMEKAASIKAEVEVEAEAEVKAETKARMETALDEDVDEQAEEGEFDFEDSEKDLEEVEAEIKRLTAGMSLRKRRGLLPKQSAPGGGREGAGSETALAGDGEDWLEGYDLDEDDDWPSTDFLGLNICGFCCFIYILTTGFVMNCIYLSMYMKDRQFWEPLHKEGIWLLLRSGAIGIFG